MQPGSERGAERTGREGCASKAEREGAHGAMDDSKRVPLCDYVGGARNANDADDADVHMYVYIYIYIYAYTPIHMYTYSIYKYIHI